MPAGADMRLTELVDPDTEGRVRCGVCQWRCSLAPGEAGRCEVRAASVAGIELLNDGMISAANFGPIEDHRLWHFFPDTQVLALGSWGYAFPADQQRGHYGVIPDDESKRRRLSPERAAAVSLEYVTDILKFSRASSRYTALVTTGYSTLAAVDQFGHYLDEMSLELRAFDDGAYKRLAGVDDWRGILDFAAHAKHRWNCHIEITTRLHPHVNDSIDQIQAIGGWIRDTLGAHTAWHLLPGDAGAAAGARAGAALYLWS